ncbi:MAG TPA: hypothetical protein VHP36_05335, partial [Chitinispirillaceae bacterium]|nr:hypothetical protein [Chitinispirillaceae bacterium]
MRSFVKILILLLFITAQIPSVSARQSKTRCEPQKVRVGNVFYTRFSLFYEYGLHNTTNYRRGTFVPVNTPVTFQGKEGNNLFVTLPDGEKISIYNGASGFQYKR